MTSDITPDEQPKNAVARKVVTEKKLYFVPAHGVSVDAKDAADAVEKAKKRAKPQDKSADSAEEEGDG